MKYLPILLVVLAVFSGMAACIDPFDPPEVNSGNRYLVFDGYLQANGTDTSWVILSRTQPLKESTRPLPVLGASITVSSGSTELKFFPEITRPGTYFLPPLKLNTTEQYKLRIVLNDGKTYESSEQPLLTTPDIDSITYEVVGNDGVQIYANTHDPAGKTTFYKWTYDETWQYSTPMVSSLEVIKDRIVNREVSVFECWNNYKATNINVFTTASLSSDLVRLQPVNYVPINTNKLFWKYSINVKQQALSREGFDYWSEIARNTETNGSIFDPFPQQVTGNIRNLNDPRDFVFGFFTGGETKTKRIFIEERLGRSPNCFEIDTVNAAEAIRTTRLIANEIPLVGYIVAPAPCLDCRTQGGTLTRPSFWR